MAITRSKSLTPPPAVLDRLVADRRSGLEQLSVCRMSELAGTERLVLLGEPGSGKSTVFDQVAAEAGSAVVTARRFVGGARPAGQFVFVDALEEFCIGEAAHDRVNDVADALNEAGYGGWRIACRAISLPPASAALLAELAGDYAVFELEPLDRTEQLAVLASLGAADPREFIHRVEAMAAGPLLGNPATLKLLRVVLASETEPIRTRGQLFAAAIKGMAQEVNPNLPDNPNRVVSRVVEAAEQACLILLLSARTDIWRLGTAPPGDHAITRDDLLSAGIDTEALGLALDTPMFRGEGGSFMPAHRVVAEYLGGRALARATAPTDHRRPALSLDRALAFVCGDDDRPAPALAGLFAWFATELANTDHASRALDLVRANPEAILFQGDAALLPAPHRRALLEAVGRGDPWFLGGPRGSTAIGGLAGEDIAAEMTTIFRDPAESMHRRAMVLDAFRLGAPVVSVRDALAAFAVDPAQPQWLRRYAIDAFIAHAPEPRSDRRALMDVLKQEPAATSTILRLDLLPEMVGAGATTDEVRQVLSDYRAADDGVLGYARSLTDKLERGPLVDLFDAPVRLFGQKGGTRAFELSRAACKIMAVTIAANPALTAKRLLSWLENAGSDDYDEPDDIVRIAIQAWMATAPDRPAGLFWALVERRGPGDCWRVGYDFHRLTGVPVPASIRAAVLDRLEAVPPNHDAASQIELATRLVTPHEEEPELYWRLWSLLEALPEAAAAFEAFTQAKPSSDAYDPEQTRRERAETVAAAKASDQTWFLGHEADVRSGKATGALAFGAEIYLGFRADREANTGLDGVQAWCGDDVTASITSGWDEFVDRFPLTARQLGVKAAAGQTVRLTYIAAAWLDLQLQRGVDAEPSPTVGLAALPLSYVFRDEARRRRFETAAARCLLRDAEGQAVLVAFWRAAAARATQSMPLLLNLEGLGAPPSIALRTLLRARPDLEAGVLADVLAGAGKALPLDELRKLVARSLRKTLPRAARRVWRFAAFYLDPEANEAAFDDDFADPEAHALFAGSGSGRLVEVFNALTDTRLLRSAIIVRRLGALYPPTKARTGFSEDLDQVVAAAIETLARSPTSAAREHLWGLREDPQLDAWSDVLHHQAAKQDAERRQLAFRPPAPEAVAKALIAGPPATPADVRAVVGETIRQLAEDVRSGDTAPWRGYWTRPGGERGKPKIENDCRDLLLDRLRDRLQRFGIKARWMNSEVRSLNDRRADMLIVGDGEAAVPVEAKRHFNAEVWTAVDDQLLPYCRSAKSNGHGILLIFWFGIAAGAVPGRPEGGATIQTPDALKQALEERLAGETRARIEVVIFDVSGPPAEPNPPNLKRRRSRSKTTR